MNSMFDNTTTVTLESVNKLVQGMNKSHEIVLQAIDKMDAGIVADWQMLYDRQGETLDAVTQMVPILTRMTEVMVKQSEQLQKVVVRKPSKAVLVVAVAGGAVLGYKFAKAQSTTKKEQ